MKSLIIQNKNINPEYVLYYLLAFNREILNHCSKHGTTVQSINSSYLYNYPIPMPPNKEQNEIVTQLKEKLSIIDVLEFELTNGQNRADILRQSILKSAFEGKLVSQNPSEESAEKLLQRVSSTTKSTKLLSFTDSG